MNEPQLRNGSADINFLGFCFSWNFKKEVHVGIAKAHYDYESPTTVILKP
jgi:hypothetical protein